jgi:hypothetical protein
MDEIYQEPVPASGGMLLSELALFDLNRAAKWAKFLAIVGLIFSVIIGIAAFFIGSIFSRLNGLSPYGAIFSAMASAMTVIYLIVAAIAFTINLFLYQFASRTVTAIALKDGGLMERGIHRLQSYFKSIGIIMIVELSLIALGMIFAIFATMLHH